MKTLNRITIDFNSKIFCSQTVSLIAASTYRVLNDEERETLAEITLEQAAAPVDYKVAEFLKYSAPWKFTDFAITPFIGDEPFFNGADNFNFVRNRIYAGVDFKLTSNVKGLITYYSQNDKKAAGWKAGNVIMAQVKYTF